MKKMLFATLLLMILSPAIAAPLIPPGMMACPGCGASDSEYSLHLVDVSSSKTAEIECRKFKHNIFRNGSYVGATTISVCETVKSWNLDEARISINLTISNCAYEYATKVQEFVLKALKKEKNGLPKRGYVVETIVEVDLMDIGDAKKEGSCPK